MGYTLITGASSGIGRALALTCAQEGQDLVITARDEARLRQLKTEVETKMKVKVQVVVADLSKPDGPKTLHDFTAGNNLDVDILINNAGFSDWTRYMEANWAKTDAMMQVNMHAVAELSYLYGRDMVAAGRGRILNISSLASTMPGPYMAMYFATKAFVRSLGTALSYELRGTGVTVTTVCPGPVTTGFAKAANMHGKNFYTMVKPATAQQVAQFAFNKMMTGRSLAYQGWFAKLGAFGARLAPTCLAAHIAAVMNGGDPDRADLSDDSSATPAAKSCGCPVRKTIARLANKAA
ncbi:SDR family NAD(P)-dependent oxidoreductase [Bifidobacterium choloepi]|uniref:SDR family oxidoreductase n=1 Tax=Bifidobacterium choloepi TaxID=2614131 RepID=A0A6I5MYJ7_9BIFI|nr:SDR family oxidoreductase [Bifidobacterium choloepi]NEG69347.1 SDR family oxidoreductase [Bifidobacterium choloepi]